MGIERAAGVSCIEPREDVVLGISLSFGGVEAPASEVRQNGFPVPLDRCVGMMLLVPQPQGMAELVQDRAPGDLGEVHRRLGPRHLQREGADLGACSPSD